MQAKRSRYNWTEEKKVALLTQIVATGKVAFLTAKDAKVGEEFVSQLDVWTNAEHGIIPILNMHAPEFKDNPIKSTCPEGAEVFRQAAPPCRALVLLAGGAMTDTRREDKRQSWNI